MKKNFDDEREDRKLIADQKKEKYTTVFKRRDHLRDEFEKGLKLKEQHYLKRMEELQLKRSVPRERAQTATGTRH
jgi:hypothetical protein